MGDLGGKPGQTQRRVVILAGGRTLTAAHGYLSTYEAYQAPAVEAAGALGEMSGGSWRMLLLGGAAAGALSLAASREGHAAPDPCSPLVGGTRTCTGNQSAGISYNGGGLTTLNVNSLTQNIAPAANTDGIRFTNNANVTVNSNTLPFNITTAGTGRGIHAQTSAGAVTVTHTGDIAAGGRAVHVFSTGGAGATANITGTLSSATDVGIYVREDLLAGVSITHSGGSITAASHGIEVRAFPNGRPFTVTNTGAITSTGGQGIRARSYNPAHVIVTQTGDITAAGSGIYATSTSAVTVGMSGNVTSAAGRGIHAYGGAVVSVTHAGGTVSGAQEGIRAESLNNHVTVTNTGAVVSTGGTGIFADGNGGTLVSVVQSGTVSGAAGGITAYNEGAAVAVTNSGTVAGGAGRGIQARVLTGGGAATVTHSGGAVTANTHGIFARAGSGAVTVTSTGAVTSAASIGVYGRSGSGQVSITQTGNVTAAGNAVHGRSGGAGVVTASTGTLTSTGGRGIYARTSLGAVTVTHTGDIAAQGQAVHVFSTGGAGATANITGTLSSATDVGIYVREDFLAGVSVTHSGGSITAASHGIEVRAFPNGRPFNVTNTGAITSTGGDGIRARSYNPAPVVVTQTGDITAAGSGIYASNTDGTVTVNTGGGTVTGTTAGVRFSTNAGATVTLTNLAGGTITSPGNAVQGTLGDETVNNSGTITGNVDLGTGTNTFNNLAGGTFNSGATVVLTGVNVLTNSGNVSPGGQGTIQTTALTGTFTQNAGGTTTIDVNMAAMTNDRVDVTGTANLAGSVTLNMLNVTNATQTITVQNATVANVDNGLTLNAPAAVLGTLAVNANNVQVTFNVNFLGAGGGSTLTPNQQATATTLNAILASGAPGAQGLLTALANLPAGVFQDALDQLSPEALGNLSFTNLLASLGFTDNALSCKQAAGTYAFVKEAQCVWIRPGARRFSQDRQVDGSNLGFSETAFGLSAGAQAALDREQTWIAGLSAGYEHADFEGNSGRNIITGDRFLGSAVIKYVPGPVLLAAGITGGYGTFESARTISFTGFNGVAEGDFNSVFVNGRLRAAYLFDGPSGQQADWYVKPALDIDLIWSRRGGFTETGAGAANLAVESESQFNAVFSPSVEFGAELRIGAAAARPFLKVGAQIFSKTGNDVTASFAAAPGSPNFTTTSKTDRVFGTVSTGVDVVYEKALSLKLQYDGKFSGNSRSHAIGAKFSWRF